MSTLPAGITPAGSGKVGSQDVKWNILGHVYWLKAESDDCFSFETLDPPGTFVPPHVHPAQDEFIYMLEGTFDLYLAGSCSHARISASPASRAATQNLADFTSTLYPPIGGPARCNVTLSATCGQAIAYALAAGGAQCSIAASPFRIDS